MASERDQLWQLMHEHVNYYDHSHDAAVDAILTAGWRPPFPETNDPDELPPGSIVLRDGVTWHRDATHWHLTCGGHARWDRPFGSGPVTVVYVPTEEDRRGE